MKSYENREVCQLLGLNERELRYWAVIRLVAPDHGDASGPGTRRKYSERNLYQLAVVKALKDGGIPTRKIGEVLESLDRLGFPDADQAAKFMLITGPDVQVLPEWPNYEAWRRGLVDRPDIEPLETVHMGPMVQEQRITVQSGETGKEMSQGYWFTIVIDLEGLIANVKDKLE